MNAIPAADDLIWTGKYQKTKKEQPGRTT